MPRRILTSLAMLALVAALLAAGLTWWVWNGGRPRRTGFGTIEGLEAPVTVRYSALEPFFSSLLEVDPILWTGLRRS